MFALRVKNKEEIINFLLSKDIRWNAGQYADQYDFRYEFICFYYSIYRRNKYTIGLSRNLKGKVPISLNVLKYIIKI